MNIPDKAVEAAWNACEPDGEVPNGTGGVTLSLAQGHILRMAVEAAAPFIAAQALRDAAERYEWEISMDQETPSALREWADELDQQ